jgi:hypothetical protein
MTNAEYRAARKEAMPSDDKPDRAKDKEADPELNEVIPLAPTSRLTTPCSEPGQIKCKAAGE